MTQGRAFNFDFMSRARLAVIGSVVLIVVSLASLAVQGLNLGIDFTGGTVVEVGYEQAADLGEVRAALGEGGFPGAVAQHYGTARDVLVRIPPGDAAAEAKLSTRVLAALSARSDGEITIRRVEFVGPQVGDELLLDGGLAILFALLGILAYVAFRFEHRFALGAILALVHDVIVTVGVFSLLRIEFDLTVLAAVLAVIGYSLNDTIVIYDRVRENFPRMRKAGTVEIINRSINDTLTRTIATSVTTLLALLPLLLVGGQTIFGFALALTIGVLVGTYSTIYMASWVLLPLGLKREDMLAPVKEGA